MTRLYLISVTIIVLHLFLAHFCSVVYASFADEFQGMKYIWNETYYKRAFDNSDLWMFSASYISPDRKLQQCFELLPLH